jgi:hypothetical protein
VPAAGARGGGGGRHGAVRAATIPAVIAEALERLPATRVHSFESLYDADREARRLAGALVEARTAA